MSRKPYSDRELIEDCWQLSIKDLKQYLNKGFSILFISFPDTKRIICKIYSDTLEISYDNNTENGIVSNIEYISHPCNYGGVRFYFSCPKCGQKFCKLFSIPFQADFACKKCHNLTYRSQKEHLKSEDMFNHLAYRSRGIRLALTGKKKNIKKALKLFAKARSLTPRLNAMFEKKLEPFFGKDNKLFQSISK